MLLGRCCCFGRGLRFVRVTKTYVLLVHAQSRQQPDYGCWGDEVGESAAFDAVDYAAVSAARLRCCCVAVAVVSRTSCLTCFACAKSLQQPDNGCRGGEVSGSAAFDAADLAVVSALRRCRCASASAWTCRGLLDLPRTLRAPPLLLCRRCCWPPTSSVLLVCALQSQQ